VPQKQPISRPLHAEMAVLFAGGHGSADASVAPEGMTRRHADGGWELAGAVGVPACQESHARASDAPGTPMSCAGREGAVAGVASTPGAPMGGTTAAGEESAIAAEGALPVFVPAGKGRLAVRPRPGTGQVARWVEVAGATHLVTLLRGSEAKFEEVQQQAAQAMETGLKGWLHLPLSGKRAIIRRSGDRSAEDTTSLARATEVSELLLAGASVVVHCAAGQHRTGVVCYLALRLVGQGPDEALESILGSRPITHVEMTRSDRKHVPLCSLAEEYFRDTLLPSLLVAGQSEAPGAEGAVDVGRRSQGRGEPALRRAIEVWQLPHGPP